MVVSMNRRIVTKSHILDIFQSNQKPLKITRAEGLVNLVTQAIDIP